MGIKKLSSLIASEVPAAIKKVEHACYLGKVIAIDASIILYQFLTTARVHSSALANEGGDDTSHLSGVLYRSLKLLEAGIKPIFVFDGEPPKEKTEELKKRTEAREKVGIEIEKAKENGDYKLADALSKRTVRITEKHFESCKKLLGILGIPCVVAAGEAEAQCALLVKNGLAHGVATEDMDALTFGTKYLIRRFNAPKDKDKPMLQYDLELILQTLELTQEEFIDLCILLGCDYCDTIKGIGPTTALKLIKTHRKIENVIDNIGTKKYAVPERFDYQSARYLFLHPNDVTDSNTKFVWGKPNVEELYKYMVEENNFDATRINNCIERIKKIQSNSGQRSLESFFAAAKRPSLELVTSMFSTSIQEVKPVKCKKK